MKTNIQDLILNKTNYMLLPFEVIKAVGLQPACLYAFLVNKANFYTTDWFYCTISEIEGALGIGRKAQAAYTDQLVEAGLLICELRADSLKYYNINSCSSKLIEYINNSVTPVQKEHPPCAKGTPPLCKRNTPPVQKEHTPLCQKHTNKEYTKEELIKEVNKEEVKSPTLGVGFEKLVLNSDLVKSWIAETGYQASEGLGLLLNEYFIKKNTKKDANSKKIELQKFLNKAQAEKTPDVVLVEYMNQALKGKSGKPWAVLDWYEENIQKLVQKRAVEVVSNSLLDIAEARALWGAFATAFTWEIKKLSTDGDKEISLRNLLAGSGLMHEQESEFKHFVSKLPVGTDLAEFVGIVTTLLKHLGVEYETVRKNVYSGIYTKARASNSITVAERMDYFRKWSTGGEILMKGTQRAPVWKVQPSQDVYFFHKSLKAYFVELRQSQPLVNDPVFKVFWDIIFKPQEAKASPKQVDQQPVKIQDREALPTLPIQTTTIRLEDKEAVYPNFHFEQEAANNEVELLNRIRYNFFPKLGRVERIANNRRYNLVEILQFENVHTGDDFCRFLFDVCEGFPSESNNFNAWEFLRAIWSKDLVKKVAPSTSK